MKKKVAGYKTDSGEHVTTWDVSDYMEENEDYTRMTEIVEVDLPDLPPEEVVPLQLKAIDRAIEEVRVNSEMHIQNLMDKRGKLLALTHEPADDLNETIESIGTHES